MVLFADWEDAAAARCHTYATGDFEEYIPGQFFRRELPVITSAIADCGETPTTLLIDAYVDLDHGESPGLGRYLYDFFDREIPVIGLAKTRFRNTTHAIEILRGESARPLFVTAAGISATTAAESLIAMHGPNRIPDLVKLADTLARRGVGSATRES